VAFFAASVLPATAGIGLIDIEGAARVAMPIASALWVIGALFALFAAVSTLHYWDSLPLQTRLLGALPLLTVSLSLTLLLGAALIF
jgi:hypothetical protein